VTVENNLKCKE